MGVGPGPPALKLLAAQQLVNVCVINIKYLKGKQIRKFEFKCNINMKTEGNEFYIMHFYFLKPPK